MPTVLREAPDLSVTEALILFESTKPDDLYLGLITLFRRHPNALDFWTRLVQQLLDKPLPEIPPLLVYFLAHIPWHDDIAYSGEPITEHTKAHVRSLLAHFSREEVVKLLCFINEEEGISRGAIGQSVEAIISSLPHALEVLKEIVSDRSLDSFVRECAALILAMHEGVSAIPVIEQLADTRSWYADEIIRHIKEYGGINPYA